jgi:hypothetical protein
VRTNAFAVCCVLAVAVLSVAGCSGDSPTGPTPTFGATTTETFSGSIAIGASSTHAFTATTGGVITITIGTVAPTSSTLLRLGIGTWDGGLCTVVLTTPQASQGLAYEASITAGGNYCITLSDPGTFLEEMAYSVQVAHP